MRYVALILKGFKRFALNQVSHFEIRPKEQVQLILGTNGSGKSSLLQEMTPLPANPADYLKTGSKEVHIVDRGFSYVLKSDFAVKQIHSFLKDGEELNPGGTGSVQKELVRQHFGITPDIHELSTGLVRLTDLGPSKRREWFTALSDVRYDYAINVFEKLRKEHRSVVGALDLDKKRLVNEQTKIITDDEQRQLHADVKELHATLTHLFEIKEPIKRPLADIQTERRQVEQQLLDISNQLLNLKVLSPASMYRDDWGTLQHMAFDSIDAVQHYIESIREDLTAQEAVFGKMVQDHGKLKETVDVLKKAGSEGVESIRKTIEVSARMRMDHLKKRRLGLELGSADPLHAYKTHESIHQDLVSILFELPSNEDKQFGSAILQSLKEKASQVKELILKKTRELAQAQARKQHTDEHRENGAQTCPKCNHRFHVGLNEQQYEGLKNYIVLLQQEIELSEKTLKELEGKIAEQDHYGTVFRQFIQLTRSTPTLKAFWEYVAERGLITTAPRAIASDFQIFGNDLQEEVRAKAMDDHIEEKKKLLAQAEQLGDQNLTEATEKLNAATVEIEQMTKALTNTRKDLNEFYAYRKQLETATSLQLRVREYLERFNTLTYDVVETLRLQTIQQCIQQTQSALARKEETLNTLKQQQAIVENLKVTIAIRAKEEIAIKAAVKALSPTDGLIAEGMLGFVRQFTREMNQLIRKIWAYTLEVQPCGISTEQGAELDYKFPMIVGSRDNIVPDVSRGSSGMQEIVDLAWKVVGLKYSDQEHGALLLDEFGKTLDLEHRTAAIMAIKSLLETKPFSQLFMISHYESHYGAFSNAEVCVLDARNIAVPKVYNQHVTIH